MTRRLIPPPDSNLDDELEGEVDDELSSRIIYDKYMEDINGILNQAYVDIEAQIALLVEALHEDK